MPKCVCVRCGSLYQPEKVGVYYLEFADDKPYKLWACDLLKCSACGHEILAGFPFAPVLARYHEDFDNQLEKYYLAHVVYEQNKPPAPPLPEEEEDLEEEGELKKTEREGLRSCARCGSFIVSSLWHQCSGCGLIVCNNCCEVVGSTPICFNCEKNLAKRSQLEEKPVAQVLDPPKYDTCRICNKQRANEAWQACEACGQTTCIFCIHKVDGAYICSNCAHESKEQVT